MCSNCSGLTVKSFSERKNEEEREVVPDGDWYKESQLASPVRGETREYEASQGGLALIDSIARGTK